MGSLRRIYFKKDTIYHKKHYDKRTKHFLIEYLNAQMANICCERPDGHYSICVPRSCFEIEDDGIFVKVVQYKGKSGGFATKETDIFSTYLCNGSKSICLDNCSWGFSTKKQAMDVADLYGSLLTVPVKFYIEN